MPTTGDRAEMLIFCIESWRSCVLAPALIMGREPWHMVVVAQDYTLEQAETLSYYEANMPMTVIYLPDRVGAHIARVTALESVINEVSGDGVFLSLDDDMRFLEFTNYEPVVKAVNYARGTGLVSTNWVLHTAKIERKTTKMRHEFIPQPIVYTGGGLLFSREVAEVILQMPRKPYFSDNVAWSLQTYINGYVNMRYMNSLSLHLACRSGGRKGFVRNEDVEHPDPDLIRLRDGSHLNKMHNNYLIGDSRDLTLKAHSMHLQNRKTQ